MKMGNDGKTQRYRQTVHLRDGSGQLITAVIGLGLADFGLQLRVGMIITVIRFVYHLAEPSTSEDEFYTVVMVLQEASIYDSRTSNYRPPSDSTPAADLLKMREAEVDAWLGWNLTTSRKNPRTKSRARRPLSASHVRPLWANWDDDDDGDDDDDDDDDDDADPQLNGPPWGNWEVVIQNQVDTQTYKPLCKLNGSGVLNPIPLYCDGSRCSGDGVFNPRCVALTRLPQHIPLAMLQAYCPFPSRGATNVEKRRFLLYYWFAVDVYGAFGFRNRKKKNTLYAWLQRLGSNFRI
jgi:hypothetical protein